MINGKICIVVDCWLPLVFDVPIFLNLVKPAEYIVRILRAAKLLAWVRRYLTDAEFRWEVEKRGYKAEILYKLNHGVRVYAEYYANILSGSSYDNMISYEEALKWVKEVMISR